MLSPFSRPSHSTSPAAVALLRLLLSRDHRPGDVLPSLPGLGAPAVEIWAAGDIEDVTIAGEQHALIAAGIFGLVGMRK